MKEKNVLILANDTTYTYNLRDELIRGLINKGARVHFAGALEAFVDELKGIGCEIHPISVERRGTNPLSDITLIFQYIKLMRQIKPYAVLGYNIKPNIYGGVAAQLMRIDFFPNVTGLGVAVLHKGLMSKLTHVMYKVGLRRAKCIFFQNESNKRYMLEQKIVTASHESVVLPGSGVALAKNPFESYPEETDIIRFLFVGRIMRDKGIQELLEAAKIVKERYPFVEINIIGGCDEDLGDMLKMAHDQGLINYLGRINGVHDYIKAAHCIVLPSYHEGMANVLLESAAAGRPVIATKVPGCIETFDDGVTGFGCNVRDAVDLASKMIAFIDLPYSKKVAMGAAGRAKIEKQFDRHLVVQAYIRQIFA